MNHVQTYLAPPIPALSLASLDVNLVFGLELDSVLILLGGFWWFQYLTPPFEQNPRQSMEQLFTGKNKKNEKHAVSQPTDLVFMSARS